MEAQRNKREGGFSLRAIFIGILLISVNCYWTTVVENEWFF